MSSPPGLLDSPIESPNHTNNAARSSPTPTNLQPLTARIILDNINGLFPCLTDVRLRNMIVHKAISTNWAGETLLIEKWVIELAKCLARKNPQEPATSWLNREKVLAWTDGRDARKHTRDLLDKAWRNFRDKLWEWFGPERPNAVVDFRALLLKHSLHRCTRALDIDTHGNGMHSYLRRTPPSSRSTRERIV